MEINIFNTLSTVSGNHWNPKTHNVLLSKYKICVKYGCSVLRVLYRLVQTALHSGYRRSVLGAKFDP